MIGVAVVAAAMFCAPCRAENATVASSRVVVTFKTAKDNNVTGVDLAGMRIVKQYGRRLVLDLGSPIDLGAQRELLTARLTAVQSVELDYLVNAGQLDLDVSDALVVTNATDPSVDGAVISPASQTPLWNLRDDEPYSIRAEGVWGVTNSTPDVVVAVIDTGIAELAKPVFLNLLDGYDFITDDGISIDWDGRDPDATDPGDWGDMCPTPSWHGTKVASILAARHDNEFGMKGVAQNCSVLPLRVLGLCRMGYATDVTDAIVWAAGGVINGVPDNTNPAKVISLSLAGQGACPNYLQSAVTQAVELGAVVIAAAGNSNQNVSGFFPANCEGVVAVAASTREGKLAGYSNWGDLIAVSAPGGDPANAIMALSLDALEAGLEASFGIGTSFAAPHVAGAAAIYESVMPANYYRASNQQNFLSFTVNISCAMNSCGRGTLSIEKMKLEKTNTTFIESLAQWNISGNLTMGQSGICCRLNPHPSMGGAVSVPVGRECNPTSSSSYVGHDGWRYVICIDVRDCRGGTYQDVVNQPYCKRCPAGTANPNIGSTSFSACQLCSPRTFSSTEASDFCNGCPANTVSNWGFTQCLPRSNDRTRFFVPGFSDTCQWMNAYNLGCACWGSLSSVWNENNGPNPLTSGLPALCSTSCRLSDNNPPPACGGSSYTAVSTGTSFANQPQVCSQCFQSIQATVPANCFSSSPPIVQQCYIFQACSGCGCFRNEHGGTAMCHSCASGYYSAVPTFTSCVACPVGTFSSSVGLLDVEEADASTIDYSFSGTHPSTGCNQPQMDTIGGAWCSSSANSGWIQIDLRRTRFVKGFVTQGRITPDGEQYVKRYRITHSLDGTTWNSFQNNVYDGNGDWGTRRVNFVFISGAFTFLNTRYVRLELASSTTESYHGHFSLRWTVLVAPLDRLAPCTPCASGTFSTANGSTACSSCTCNAGSFWANPCGGTSAGNCNLCVPGKFSSAAGSAICTDCAAGTFSTASGATLCSTCTCNAGSFWATTCGGSSAGTCNLCGPGTFSSAAGTSSCTNCLAGTYRTASGGNAASSCTPCDAGKYSAVVGANSATTCLDCPAGKYRLTTGASALSDCVDCPTGTYRTSAGASLLAHCVACDAGKFSGVLGAISATVCSNCIAGTFSTASGASTSGTCQTCPAGRYSATQGASASSACLACGAGKFSGTQGANSETMCSNCIAGTFSTAQGASAVGTCQTCPAGTYSATQGAAASSACIACVAGKFSTVLGATAVGTCNNCDPGTASSAVGASSAAACVPCTTGCRYADTSGMSACLACASSIVCNPTLEFIKKCSTTSNTRCAVCSEHFSKPDNSHWTGGAFESCTWACNTGFFRTSGNVCQACRIPSDCSTGEYVTSCTPTANGVCTSCTNGPTHSSYTNRSPDPGSNACPWRCNAGYTAGPSVCNQCGTGRYSAAGDSACTSCDAGKFSAALVATGPALCVNCGPGTFSAVGASACTNCGAGTFSTVTGAQSVATCTNCRAGTFSSSQGAVSSLACTNCDAGRFSAVEGAVSSSTCQQCGPGTFSAAGAGVCSNCGPNTFNPSNAATSCTPCTHCTAAGHYKAGCSGASPGTCERCTNT